MRNWVLRLALLAGLLALVFWGWRILFPSPERVIRKRLVEVAQLVSFGANEAPLAKLANSAKLSTYFTPDVEIAVDVPGRSHAHTFSGRDELVQAAMTARSQMTSLQLEFLDINVTVGPEKTSAAVDLTAKGKIGGERDIYVQELKVALKKVERAWLVNRVEGVKTLL